jgi:hypothetical protein
MLGAHRGDPIHDRVGRDLSYLGTRYEVSNARDSNPGVGPVCSPEPPVLLQGSLYEEFEFEQLDWTG